MLRRGARLVRMTPVGALASCVCPPRPPLLKLYGFGSPLRAGQALAFLCFAFGGAQTLVCLRSTLWRRVALKRGCKCLVLVWRLVLGLRLGVLKRRYGSVRLPGAGQRPNAGDNLWFEFGELCCIVCGPLVASRGRLRSLASLGRWPLSLF